MTPLHALLVLRDRSEAEGLAALIAAAVYAAPAYTDTVQRPTGEATERRLAAMAASQGSTRWNASRSPSASLSTRLPARPRCRGTA